jgi:hypothetical protein
MKALAEQCSLKTVETVECWNRLFPNPQYSETESKAVFQLVQHEIDTALAGGASVVTEGVFASYERIQRLNITAQIHSARFLVIGLWCDLNTALARMKHRFNTTGQARVPAEAWLQLEAKLMTWRAQEGVLWIDTVEDEPKSTVKKVIKVLLPLS